MHAGDGTLACVQPGCLCPWCQWVPRGEVRGEGLPGQPGPRQLRSVGSACLPVGGPVRVDHRLWMFSHPAGIQLRGLGGFLVLFFFFVSAPPLPSLSLFGDFLHSAFDLPPAPCLPSRSLGSLGLEAEVSAFPIPNTQKHQWEGRGFRLQPSRPPLPPHSPRSPCRRGAGDGLSPTCRGTPLPPCPRRPESRATAMDGGGGQHRRWSG